MNTTRVILFLLLILMWCAVNLGFIHGGFDVLKFKGEYFRLGFWIQGVAVLLAAGGLVSSRSIAISSWISFLLVLTSVFLLAYGTTGEHRTFDFLAAWPCVYRITFHAWVSLVMAFLVFRSEVFSSTPSFLIIGVTMGMFIREPFCDSDRLNHYLFGHFLIPFLVLGVGLAYCRGVKSMFDWRHEIK